MDEVFDCHYDGAKGLQPGVVGAEDFRAGPAFIALARNH